MGREVREKQLLKLSEKKNKAGNEKTVLRVVQWNNSRPTIEKRNFWKDDDGSWKFGKLKGLGADDLSAIQEHWDDIVDLMSVESERSSRKVDKSSKKKKNKTTSRGRFAESDSDDTDDDDDGEDQDDSDEENWNDESDYDY